MDGPICIFAAVARLLVATKGRERVPVGIVQVDRAGPHPSGNFAGMGDVFRILTDRRRNTPFGDAGRPRKVGATADSGRIASSPFSTVNIY